MLFANSNFKDLLVEGALFNSGIEIQCVNEHVWVGRGGLRGRDGLRGRVGSYQPGVYVPLKALFLVLSISVYILHSFSLTRALI